MKKLLLAVLLLTASCCNAQILGVGRRKVFSSSCGFTIVHVTSQTNFGTMTVTIPATTAGNTLLIWFANGSDGTLPTITDNQGSTYTVGASWTTGNGTELAYNSDIPAGVTGVTITLASTRIGVVIAELSDCSPLGAPMDTIGAWASGFASGGSTNPITTTHAADTIFGVVFANDSTITYTASDCALVGQAHDATLAGSLYVFQKPVSTTGTYDCTVTGTASATVRVETSSVKHLF